jgi:hypothetical protein
MLLKSTLYLYRLKEIIKYFEIKANRSLREIMLSELLPLFKCPVMSTRLINGMKICTEYGKNK